MADTIPDIEVTKDDWVNVNTLSSVPVGTAMVLTNKSYTSIVLFISPTKPDANSDDGIPMAEFPNILCTRTIDAGESAIWAKADSFTARLSVQEG